MPGAPPAAASVRIGVFVVDGAAAGDLAVGVIFFFGAGGGVPVEIGGDADDGLAGAEHFFQHAFGFLGEILFEIAAGGELVVGKAGDGIILLVFREDVALVVHHGNIVGLQAFHAVGDQEANGIDGGRRQLAVALDADKDGGGGFARAVGQQPVLRHDDHDAGGFDLIELADGAGQFALNGTGIIGALNEIGDTETGLVENLKADPFTAGNALAGHLHPDLVDFVRWHENGAAAAADLIGDLGFIERGDDFGGLPFVQFAVKEGVIHAAGPESHGGEAGQHYDRGGEDADALVQAELLPDGGELPGDLREVFIHETKRRRQRPEMANGVWAVKNWVVNHICIRISSW